MTEKPVLLLPWPYSVFTSIFPWHINKWTEAEMEISCHDRCVLKLDLVEQSHGMECFPWL